MTEDRMALIELAEKHADGDLLRELGELVLQRLMDAGGRSSVAAPADMNAVRAGSTSATASTRAHTGDTIGNDGPANSEAAHGQLPAEPPGAPEGLGAGVGGCAGGV